MRGLKLLAAAAAVFVVSEARADTQLITNGGFETGLAGWSVTNQAGGSGNYFASSATVAPQSGLPTVGPKSGLSYAVSDTGGPGAHALAQTFLVPGPASKVILTFDMFVNDWDGGPVVNPAGLDFTAGSNQHARVDLLTPGAGPLTTTTGLLQTFYASVDAGNDPHAYTSYSFDITSLVGSGGLFKLRFGEVDNGGVINQGIDNVSIDFTAAAAPVPVPMAAYAGVVLFGGLGASRRLRRQRAEA